MLVGYSSIVSIKCDYPSCEAADEFFDAAGAADSLSNSVAGRLLI